MNIMLPLRVSTTMELRICPLNLDISDVQTLFQSEERHKYFSTKGDPV